MADETEFAGRLTRSGIRDAPQEKLSASEKLRLLYRDGSTNPNSPDDPSKHAWRGTDPNFYLREDIVEAKKNGV